jgi:farnesyl-diphosphate farnesyltransferase
LNLKNLNETLTTSKFVDTKTIHRFDPTPEHFGGGGDAREWLGRAASPYEGRQYAVGTKQGAYGKVKIHSHSKMEQIMRIDEVFSAVWFKYFATMPNKIDKNADEDTVFCDLFLGKVSRSFAAVIRQLPKGLCREILVFYLVLRALDTIEDDMEAFKGREKVKIQHLENFYRVALVEEGWNLQGVGEGDEKEFLSQFHRCGALFRSLQPSCQEVIADITKRMGHGMAVFVSKDLGQGTTTVDDYNLYCHYVAGLVGEGLSRLFTCTGYERQEVADVSTTLANTMGLFLQKTNIIRDYLEDYVDGRAWWPQEVWKHYTKSGDLGEFAHKDNIEQAVHCLNHLVTDALRCVPDCMDYMALLKTEEVFRFCAIPQVMAIATLAELYNNPKVFTGVVKIRKGFTAKLILDTKTPGGLHKWFNLLSKEILSKVHDDDPNSVATKAICNKIIVITSRLARTGIIDGYSSALFYAAPVGIAICALRISTVTGSYFPSLQSVGELSSPQDVFTVAAGVSLILFIVLSVIFPKDALVRADR